MSDIIHIGWVLAASNLWLSLHHGDFSQHTGVDPDLYYILATANLSLGPGLNFMDSVKWSSWSEHLPVVVKQPVLSVPSVSFRCSLFVHWFKQNSKLSFLASGCYSHIHKLMLCIMLITLCLRLLHFIESPPHAHTCTHTHTHTKTKRIYDGIILIVLGMAKPTRINPRTVTVPRQANTFLCKLHVLKKIINKKMYSLQPHPVPP